MQTVVLCWHVSTNKHNSECYISPNGDEASKRIHSKQLAKLLLHIPPGQVGEHSLTPPSKPQTLHTIGQDCIELAPFSTLLANSWDEHCLRLPQFEGATSVMC